MAKKRERFTELSLPDETRHEVAAHEVLMSFYYDDDALAFREWWHEHGTFAFCEWYKANAERLRQLSPGDVVRCDKTFVNDQEQV